jgi:hypothetical protein
MTSAKRGRSTSAAEVTNVSPHGLWILIAGEEKFLSFKAFPWFRDASISALMRVQRPSVGHLYWPDLDVDLAEASIDDPKRFPLLSKEPSKQQSRQKKSRQQAAARRKAPARRLRG